MLRRATVSERRKIGAYYTPSSLSEILCDWAIRSSKDQVLEPSFGGCSFLESAKKRLSLLGATDPNSLLYGCDIDPAAFGHLYDRLGLTQLSGHFVLGDFLALGRDAFGQARFDAVVGNPPYVRHHEFSLEQRSSASRLRKAFDARLSGTSNMWAYFVIAACGFLTDGGRAAWILPSSFGHADYADTVRAFLVANFAQVTAISLTERLFRLEGAEEATTVVIADGWHSPRIRCKRSLQRAAIHSVEELKRILSGDPSAPQNRAASHLRLFNRIASKSAQLGELCRVSIGIVTGDTRFFLFNETLAKENKIKPIDMHLIVSRGNQIPGLTVTKDSLERSFRTGARTRLLNPRTPISPSVRKYLESKTEVAVAENRTFGKRAEWFRPLQSDAPDAFLLGMSHSNPRLVLNSANVPCTNSLYEIRFKHKISSTRARATAIALMSTFSQLSAELTGRAYGAGLLKHEPSDAARIQVLISKRPNALLAKTTFYRIDRLLKSGRADDARAAADDYLVKVKLLDAASVPRLALKLARIRARRQRVSVTRPETIPARQGSGPVELRHQKEESPSAVSQPHWRT
jgi:adenine-specific DNA methylase